MNVITRQLPPLRLQSEVDCNFRVRDMRRSRSRSTHEQTDQRKRGIAAKKVGRHGAAAEALQLGTRHSPAHPPAWGEIHLFSP